MIISATIIHHPRVARRCDSCGEPLTKTVRLYGYAHHGDEPYVLYLDEGCAKLDPEVKRKLAAIEVRG